MKKIVCLILCVCLCSSLLIGCTTAETELWDSYMKTSQAKSYNMDMKLKMSVDASNVTDQAALMFLGTMDEISMNLAGNVVNDFENGVIKGKIEVNSIFMGEQFNFNIWIDFDAQNSKFTYIYELDTNLIAKIGAPQKQYYYFDMSEIISDSSFDFNSVNLFDTKQLLESLAQIDTTGMNVKKEGNTYSVSFDSETFYSLLKQYFDIIFSNPAFEALYPEQQKAEFNDALTNLSKINFFGDKEIVTTYTIDNDGYIESSNNSYEIIIDPAQISNAFGMPDAGTTDKFIIGIDMDCKYANYNTIDAIEFPALTSENSISFLEIMNTAITGTEYTDEISVFVNENRVKFDVPPQLIDGRTMVPMRAIFESLNASVDFDANTNTITSIAGDKNIVHVIGEKTIYVNNVPFEMDVASFVKDNRTLVPARFISEALGATVNWIEQVQTVVITLN